MDTPFWLSRAEVRELDRRASAEFGVPSIVLMENAGRGAAELLMTLNVARKPVRIFCGKGNNGGDGFVIARHLHNAGFAVEVIVVALTPIRGRGPKSDLSPDADSNFKIVEASGIPMWYLPPEVADVGLAGGSFYQQLQELAPILGDGWIVDALFGTGLTGAIQHPLDRVVATINASRTLVLSVDIPSGLDCDTGQALGPTVKATHTATFVAWKKGFLQPSAKPWIGEVHVIDIGAPKNLVDEFRALRARD